MEIYSYLTAMFFLYAATPFFSSPLLLSFFLVLTSLLGAFLVGSLISNWLMLVLILVFSGGMMVMMVYITNLAPSKKIKKNFLSFLLVTLGVAMSFSSGMSFNLTPSSLVSPFSSELLSFTLSFLLFGLFLVITLVNKSQGAMR